jgi:hypothetical protein
MTIATPVPVDNTLLQQRRLAVSQSATMTGLDYVRITTDPSPTLALHFIDKANANNPSVPTKIGANNIQITVKQPGGAPVKTFRIGNSPNQVGNLLTFPLNNFSNVIDPKDDTVYTLSLVNDDGVTPLAGVDVFLSQVDFSISLSNQTRLDGLQTATQSILTPATPEIDYLSRDYLSFRQLMLDRLTALVPDWQAANEADLGSVMIEILAYAADYLSYYQDAVATEAYLGTARSRISIRRHAHLLNYQVNEGCNARVWVQVAVNKELILKEKTVLCTRSNTTPNAIAPGVIDPDSTAWATLQDDPSVMQFETMYNAHLLPTHNNLSFYTWGSPSFSLAQGATSASLRGNFSSLKPGDVLAFVQTKGIDTGEAIDADISQRCVVRLQKVIPANDPLFPNKAGEPTEVTEIFWGTDDALPFEMVIAKVINGKAVTDINIALGNMVLADHGTRIYNESLSPGLWKGNYRPTLQQLNLTFTEPFNNSIAIQQNYSARQATRQDPQAAIPDISLSDINNSLWWEPRPNLLMSDYASTNFVVEMENNRTAHLRFGDGTFGKLPDLGTAFTASYRVGNGSIGNIGAESLAYIGIRNLAQSAIKRVYNPLPATGGIDPIEAQQIKLYAPKAYNQLKRCVTPQDYIEVAKGFTYHNADTGQDYFIHDVNAVLRWTGSWYTTFIAVALQGGPAFSDGFKQALKGYLANCQLMKQAFEIVAPQWVPLTIVLPVTVKAGYTPNAVLQSLMQRFSSAPGGFFYPDNFTFGQTVYLSVIVDAVMEIPGVLSVDITPGSEAVFSRFGVVDGLSAQKILINPLEIAQVSNQIPGQGSIQFIMRQEIMS